MFSSTQNPKADKIVSSADLAHAHEKILSKSLFNNGTSSKKFMRAAAASSKQVIEIDLENEKGDQVSKKVDNS